MATSVSATTTRRNIWAFIQPAEKQRADKTAQHLSRKLPQENRPQESAKGKRGENKGVGKCARYVAAVEAEPTWAVENLPPVPANRIREGQGVLPSVYSAFVPKQKSAIIRFKRHCNSRTGWAFGERPTPPLRGGYWLLG